MEIFHDISEIQMAQDALRLANKKLNLLAEITRHDIRNKLTVMGGYLDLVKEHPREPDYSMYIAKSETLSEISARISSSRDCTRTSALRRRTGRMSTMSSSMPVPGSISGKSGVQSDTGDLAIFADPLLERAFHNLAENAVQHGGNVTTIRISARESGDGATIID